MPPYNAAPGLRGQTARRQGRPKGETTTMISAKMQQAINEQIQCEFASAYLYLAMAAWLENQNLPGAAHWMKKQFAEEQTHAMKLFEHVVDRAGQVTLGGIETPKVEYGGLRQVFEAVLTHERLVTASINGLYEVALAEKDYAAQVMLQWFISEQVEEEKNVEDILREIVACDKPHLQLMVDHHLSKRA